MRAAFFVTVLLARMCLAQGDFEKRISPVAPDEKQHFQKQVKVALLVGISKYPEASGFGALNYGAADATDLAALLKEQGYLVRVLTEGDATRGAILRTLRQLGDAVDPAQGTFLFFFSGHGFSADKQNYLAPISAAGAEPREALGVGEVEQLMASSKAKRQLILLDACRYDPVTRDKGAPGRSFADFEAAEGQRILNSTRVNGLSYESPELRHGVFTAYVLDALRGNAAGADGLITFHDLTTYVTSSVRRWSFDHDKAQIQVPFETYGTKEASGEFLVAAVAANRVVPNVASPSLDSGPQPGQVKVNPKDGLTYVWIPAGSFYMGCSPGDSECFDGEKPSHNVSITKGFWLGQTTVTQEAWRRVMGTSPSRFKGSNLPVESVSWDESKRYCEAIGGRLPTEAEWEYAARAGTAGPRYGDINSIAWYDGNSGGQTHPVGTKEPNAWKLFDMLGNVRQWTGTYSAEEATDPQGPMSGQYRVVRGGSWVNNPRYVRGSYRYGVAPGNRSLVIGARCVGELP